MTESNPLAMQFELGDDGILLATLDLPGRPMNVLNEITTEAIEAMVARVETDPAVKGLVLRSGKKDFLAGADLEGIKLITAAEQAFELSMVMKRKLRRLELCGKPAAVVIHGMCFGGGLEVTLAFHQRFVVDDGRARLGTPEVKLGLLPGGGGTQRMPRLVGMQAAMPLLCEGREVKADKALAIGLVHALAPSTDAALAMARAWCLANPKARQPWDMPKFRYPGGDSRAPAVAHMLAIAPAMAAAKSWNNYPAITHIMSSVFEGGLVDIDAALQIESRYFAACLTSQAARNMLNTLWFQLNAIKKGASRPPGIAASKVHKLGILGAGMMGAGIACVSAKVGITVVLLDTTQAAADQGKAYSADLLDKALKKGRGTAEQRDALLARITPTTDYAALAGCDLLIEAVFEDRTVKAAVTQLAEAQMDAGAVLASNTSTLPITGLAAASARPASFIGLHFFSPVDKMPLVEIIVGQETSADTLARGFDYVMQIGKTPIVVNDSRGFYTSRVFGTYVMEGTAMLLEGVHPRSIEVAGLQAGMPMPPLALQDEVSLSLGQHVADQIKKDLAAAGTPIGEQPVEHPGMAAVRQLCEIGRVGKKAGQGFYDWPESTPSGAKGEKKLWPGLAAMFPLAALQPAQPELIDRLMFAQANEAARCYGEGVLRSVADANIGSIFGWGFAPFQRGSLQFINAMGAQRFVARSRELAARYGARFEPAAVVVAQAEAGGRFED